MIRKVKLQEVEDNVTLFDEERPQRLKFEFYKFLYIRPYVILSS
ncbi:hypothetical protein VQL36_08905 [Chengkuizengella sp. SCS-71B]